MSMQDKIERVVQTAQLFQKREIIIFLSSEEKKEFDSFFEQFIYGCEHVVIPAKNSVGMNIASSTRYKAVTIHVVPV